MQPRSGATPSGQRPARGGQVAIFRGLESPWLRRAYGEVCPGGPRCVAIWKALEETRSSPLRPTSCAPWLAALQLRETRPGSLPPPGRRGLRGYRARKAGLPPAPPATGPLPAGSGAAHFSGACLRLQVGQGARQPARSRAAVLESVLRPPGLLGPGASKLGHVSVLLGFRAPLADGRRPQLPPSRNGATRCRLPLPAPRRRRTRSMARTPTPWARLSKNPASSRKPARRRPPDASRTRSSASSPRRATPSTGDWPQLLRALLNRTAGAAQAEADFLQRDGGDRERLAGERLRRRGGHVLLQARAPAPRGQIGGRRHQAGRHQPRDAQGMWQTPRGILGTWYSACAMPRSGARTRRVAGFGHPGERLHASFGPTRGSQSAARAVRAARASVPGAGGAPYEAYKRPRTALRVLQRAGRA
eukprot:14222571-Alexandrium_andersonii.AAC.1